MEANQNPPSQENLHLHNEETEDKKKNQEEEEEVMMDQCLLEFVGDAVLFPLAYPYRPPVDVVVVVDLLNHPADLEKWRDYYSPSHLEKWKHGRVLYEFVHEGVIYMFVIRESPADLEKRKLMHWIRHTESISCLEQLDIGWVNMSARYYYKEIAELYEQEQSLEQTIVYYERAADLFQSECHTSANQCRQKIALEQYPKAIEIYEDIARQSLNNNLLKYGVKGHLLNAAYASYVRVMLWQSIMHWSDIRNSIQPSQEHGNTDCWLIWPLQGRCREVY